MKWVRRKLNTLMVAKSGRLSVQFVRYSFVGGLAFLVDFGTLWGLAHFAGIHYLLAAGAGFVLGLAVNYMLSVLWVFDTHRVSGRQLEFLLFAIIGLVGLGMTELFMYLFTDLGHVHYLLSKILTAILVYAWNFLARRFMLFS